MPWEGRRFKKLPTFSQSSQQSPFFLSLGTHVNLVFLGRVNGRHGWGVFDLPTVFDGAKSRSDFFRVFSSWKWDEILRLLGMDFDFSGRVFFFSFWVHNWTEYGFFFCFVKFSFFCFWLLTIILIIFFFLKFQIHHLRKSKMVFWQRSCGLFLKRWKLVATRK